jgi:hypothetical protein
VHELRYEALAEGDVATAAALASYLEAPAEPLASALARAHGSSVGRFRRDLDERQLADVEAEASDLLRELGYA